MTESNTTRVPEKSGTLVIRTTTDEQRIDTMRFKPNGVTTALAILASVIGGYGIFTALHNLQHAPIPIALLGIALFEGAAVGFAMQAIENAKEGDNPYPWLMGTVGIIVVGAAVQFLSAIREGNGYVVGIIMAMAPIVAITLLVGEISLYLRKHGRIDGSVLNPASRIPRDMVRRFPRAAGIAKNLVAIDRTLNAQDAMVQALELAPPNLDSSVAVNTNSRKTARNLTVEGIIGKAKKEVPTAPESTPGTVSTPTTTVTPNTASSNGHNVTGQPVTITRRK